MKQTLVTLEWSCGLAIGPPEWQGVDSFECPECDEEGKLVVELEELEIDDGEINSAPQIHCTACHQPMEDSSHYKIGKVSNVETAE